MGLFDVGHFQIRNNRYLRYNCADFTVQNTEPDLDLREFVKLSPYTGVKLWFGCNSKASCVCVKDSCSTHFTARSIQSIANFLTEARLCGINSVDEQKRIEEQEYNSKICK